MDAFIGEVRVFGFDFTPEYWAMCNGQAMAVMQNQTLFSVIGNRYKPSNTNNQIFYLPDLGGRVPQAAAAHTQAPQAVGMESVTLTLSQLPSHTHLAYFESPADASGYNALTAAPQSGSSFPASYLSHDAVETVVFSYATQQGGLTTMSLASINVAGGNGAHENRQPYVIMNFCIAVTGTYPESD